MYLRLSKYKPALKEHQRFILLLLFASIYWLVFIFLIPPWQHYDEPSHFEFAWLIANNEALPESGQYDQLMRRELAASMLEHNFFEDLDFRPNLLSPLEPIWVGVSQINDLFLYYYLVALPLRLVRSSDLLLQLYLARLTSLLFLCFSLIAAYGMTRALTRPCHPLRWMVPVSIILLPGFVDIMSAVNDDVGATGIFSLYLWVNILLIKRGFSYRRFLGLLITGAACFWMKNTVSLVVVIWVVPVLFSVLRGNKRKFAWLVLAIIALIIGGSIFSWGEAAHWYRAVPSEATFRSVQAQAPLGENVFRFDIQPGEQPPRLTQIISLEQAQKLQGKQLTLGAWIWASRPATVRTLVLHAEDKSLYLEVEVSPEPQYFIFETQMPPQARWVQVLLSPLLRRSDTALTVYYDGVVLLEGSTSPSDMPQFTGVDGNAGVLAGRPFHNLLYNASAEGAGLWVRTRMDKLFARYYPGGPSLLVYAIQAWRETSWYYQLSITNLVQSFWARFGWGHVTLIGYHPYLFLGLVTLVGLLGAVVNIVINRKTLPWDLICLFGIVLLLVWGGAGLRGVSSILGGITFIPSGRYAYPVIIPTMLILNWGWLAVMRWPHRWYRFASKVGVSLYFAFFIGLNVLSITSLLRYYY